MIKGLDDVAQTLDSLSANQGDEKASQAAAGEIVATFFDPLTTLLRQTDGMTDAAFVSRGKNTLHPVNYIACLSLYVHPSLLVVSLWTR